MPKEARLYNGEKTVSSITGAGKTGQLCVKKKNESYIKNKPNVRSDTVKLLQENIGTL